MRRTLERIFGFKAFDRPIVSVERLIYIEIAAVTAFAFALRNGWMWAATILAIPASLVTLYILWLGLLLLHYLLYSLGPGERWSWRRNAARLIERSKTRIQRMTGHATDNP
jgi:hypothetical protein